MAPRPSFRVLFRAAHAASALGAGALAALPAALIAALVMAAADVVTGRAATATLAAIGALVTDASASDGTVVGAGLVTHVAAAAVWGLVWGGLVAATAHHLPALAGAFWGAAFGLAVWFVDFFLILHFVAPELAAGTPARAGVAWHLAFGATLGALFHAARPREAERHRSLTHAP